MTNETEPTKTVSPELVKEDALEKAKPGAPVTIDSLAVQERGQEILEARQQILATARKHSIRLTMPEDWVLFKDGKTGKETGFLQETGCQRIRDVWGVNITPHENSLKKIEVKGSSDYGYEMLGDGFCNLTQQEVKGIVGFRGSHEKFYTDITNPIVKDQYLRKGCRANLDGNIVRELAGMKVVPIQELIDAWTGTNKNVKRCALGRGYSKDERGERESQARSSSQESRQQAARPKDGDEPGIPEQLFPRCQAPLADGSGTCDAVLKYIPPGKAKSGKTRGAFWACEGKDDHTDPRSYDHTVWHSDWMKQLQQEGAL